MTESIETKVMAAIARSQNLDLGKVTPGTTFEELGMTSLDALAMINDLEEEFGVAIPNEEAMGLASVGEAVESIRKLAAP
ncbi:MAG: acyl carrier protein [Acidobacteriota bacterium]|jgi:acyl carrier protein|nr:acyl carrier protein [Acidobacteriota bacterium]